MMRRLIGGRRAAAAALIGMTIARLSAAPVAEDIRDIRGPKYDLPEWLLPALTGFEKSLQRGHVRRVGLQLQGIDALGAKVAYQPAPSFQGQLFEALADGGARGIQFDHFAAFRILERNDPHVGKFLLAWILDVYCNQVVPAVRAAHGTAQIEARGVRALWCFKI